MPTERTCVRAYTAHMYVHTHTSHSLCCGSQAWPCPHSPPPRQALSGWVCAEAVSSHLVVGILRVLRAAAPSGLHFSEAPASPGDEGAGTLFSMIGTLPGWALGSGPSRIITYNCCLLGHLGQWACRFAPPDHADLPSCPGSGGDLCGLSWPCQPGRAGAREVGPHACPSALGLGSPRAWLSRSRLPALSAPAGPGDTAPAVSSPIPWPLELAHPVNPESAVWLALPTSPASMTPRLQQHLQTLSSPH